VSEHIIEYPFVRGTFAKYDGEGVNEIPTWDPGVRYEIARPDGASYALADALGKMVLTEVSRHKPGKFPERVFFTRLFIDPDGKSFGKGGLKIVSSAKFARLCRGYAHEFEMSEASA